MEKERPADSEIKKDTEIPIRKCGEDTENQTKRDSITPSFEEGYNIQGRYEILKKIARGGMGVIYRCKDRKIPREVAIKIIEKHKMPKNSSGEVSSLVEYFFSHQSDHPKDMDKFQGVFSHFHIVTLFDILDLPAHLGFVMEYVDSPNLEEYRKNNPISLKQAIEWFKQILAGLEIMHSQKILHCDIKPSNILITRGNGVKITDFGISVNQDCRPIGRSLDWCSPEQLKGLQLQPASDIYSAGLVFYFMLTGKTIPEKEKGRAVDRLKTSEIPKHLLPILEKMLEYEIKQRFHNASNVLRELEIMESEEEKKRKDTEIQKKIKEVGRKQRLVYTGVIGILAMLAVIAGIVMRLRRDEHQHADAPLLKKLLNANIAKAGGNIVEFERTGDQFRVVLEIDLDRDQKVEIVEVSPEGIIRIRRKGDEKPPAVYDLSQKYTIYPYPAETDRKMKCEEIRVADLTSDGTKELLVVARDIRWFATKIVALKFDRERIHEIGEYWHPGRIERIEVEDLNHDKIQEIVCIALNNHLAKYCFYGHCRDFPACVFVISGDTLTGVSQAPPYLGKAPQGREIFYYPIRLEKLDKADETSICELMLNGKKLEEALQLRDHDNNGIKDVRVNVSSLVTYDILLQNDDRNRIQVMEVLDSPGSAKESQKIKVTLSRNCPRPSNGFPSRKTYLDNFDGLTDFPDYQIEGKGGWIVSSENAIFGRSCLCGKAVPGDEEGSRSLITIFPIKVSTPYRLHIDFCLADDCASFFVLYAGSKDHRRYGIQIKTGNLLYSFQLDGNERRILEELKIPRPLEPRNWYRLILEVTSEQATIIIPEITGLKRYFLEKTIPSIPFPDNLRIGLLSGVIYLDNLALLPFNY